MNKRILPVFVFYCPLLLGTGTRRERWHQSDAMMQQIKQSYQGTCADKAIRNAISSNDIRKCLL